MCISIYFFTYMLQFLITYRNLSNISWGCEDSILSITDLSLLFNIPVKLLTSLTLSIKLKSSNLLQKSLMRVLAILRNCSSYNTGWKFAKVYKQYINSSSTSSRYVWYILLMQLKDLWLMTIKFLAFSFY